MKLKIGVFTALVLISAYTCGIYHSEYWQNSTNLLKKRILTAAGNPSTPPATSPELLVTTKAATSPEVLVTMKAAADHNRLTGTVAGYKEALDTLKWIHQETEERLANITTMVRGCYA